MTARYLDLSANTRLSYIKLGNYVPSNEEPSTESAPIETLDLSNNINLTAVVYSAFCQCYNLTSVTLPETVTEIGNMAFYKCSGLKAVVIPDGVTTLGSHAFFECKSLKSVSLSKSLTSIGTEAFRSCSSLTSVVIPDDVTTLAYGAFSYCSLLESVTLPENLETIGERAFEECNSLSSVTVKATTPPVLGDNAFFDIDRSAILYVPSESIEAYTNSDWAQYFSQILPIE